MSEPDAGRPQLVELISAARGAWTHAIAPFSGFRVGAALAVQDGTIVTGCNVENATLGLTMCAERVAMFKALSEGHRAFARIAVFTDTEEPTPPCGACRQLLWEFAGDLEIALVTRVGEVRVCRLKVLLPLPFERRLLNGQGQAADG